MALPKLNLTEMLSENGQGSYNFGITKATGNNGVIVNVHANYHNPDADPAVNVGQSENYVYEGTPAEIKTKLETLGFTNVAEI